jgi:DNA-3-methyladenine glycosylase I
MENIPELRRCEWCLGSELYVEYHDREWGVPVHDDQRLFEFLILEGAQAGLSWLTILQRRENYRKAFDEFDAAKIARYGSRHKAKLLANPGIIRNRLKIEATIGNSQPFLSLQQEHGTFDAYVWQFVDGRPRINHWKSMKQIPSTSTVSDTISRDLKKRGFRFVGSTICYAFMQAVGMVDDHLVDCFCHSENRKQRRS